MVSIARRGSYFYVIDAFIASIIILATLFILFSRFITQQPSTQALFTAEDFLSTIETTRVASDDPQIIAWIKDGTIANPQASIIEQLAYFKNTGDLDKAGTLAGIAAASAPAKVGMRITITTSTSSDIIYDQPRGAQAMNSASTVLTARRIVVLRSTPSATYPPTIIEVSTWQ